MSLLNSLSTTMIQLAEKPWLLRRTITHTFLLILDLLLYSASLDAIRYLGENAVTTLPEGIFDSLAAVDLL